MEYLRNKFVIAALAIGLSIYVGAQYQRDTLMQHTWGFPFVYKYEINEAFRFEGQTYSHFSLFLLGLNITILAFGSIFVWVLLSWLVWKIRVFYFRSIS